MKFNVVKRSTFTLYEESIKAFKEKMIQYLKNEMEEDGKLEDDEKFPYTIEDISDDIVEESISDIIQDVFENDYDDSGIIFDDYFRTISFDFNEEDVRDCIYEAVANWRTEMEV